MSRRGIKPMQSEHVNVTPLIDVIMCLIIFFLLVGHIAKKAEVKGVKIPSTKHGKDLADKSGQLIINLFPREPLVAGQQRKPKIIIWGERVSYDLLPGKLREYVHEYKQTHTVVKLVLRADKSIQYKYIAPVLIDCASVGISSIHFMTRRPG